MRKKKNISNVIYEDKHNACSICGLCEFLDCAWRCLYMHQRVWKIRKQKHGEANVLETMNKK